MRPSVSVPVLSKHSMSTRASPLDGRELLNEHLIAGELDRAHGEGDARHEDETLRKSFAVRLATEATVASGHRPESIATCQPPTAWI